MLGRIFLLMLFTYIVSFFMTGSYRIHDFAHTPQEIYDLNNVNMFGACILWVITFVINPIFYVVYFLWWITHVGRKD